MCFSKNKDLVVGRIISLGSINSVTALMLNTSPDKKAYNDYFTVEEMLPPPHFGRNTLMTIPFQDIVAISYKRPTFGKTCTVSIETQSQNDIQLLFDNGVA